MQRKFSQKVTLTLLSPTCYHQFMKTKRLFLTIFLIILYACGCCGQPATQMSDATTVVTPALSPEPPVNTPMATGSDDAPVTMPEHDSDHETGSDSLPDGTPDETTETDGATDQTSGPDAAIPIQNILPPNPYSSLSVPTQITKIGSDYFLVDCYHDQILAASDVNTPLTEWGVVTSAIHRGHTIAGNGSIYVADDTENHRLLVFEKTSEGFLQTQVIENVGVRPHYVDYHEASRSFYVLSSQTGELYVYRQDEDSPTIRLDRIMNIPEMQDVYIRSFTIDGDEIYFPASNGIILRARLEDLEILEKWTLPPELAGLVQVVKIGNFYYLTISTDLYGNPDFAGIIRTGDLSYLSDYGYKDLHSFFADTGTPYNISAFDGHYYLVQHSYQSGYGAWQFDITEDELENVIALYP